MKNTILVLLTLLLATPASADITRSPWFEPVVLCVASAGAGYALTPSDSGDELMYAGIGCALGAVAGYFINRHYENKYSDNYKKEINDKNQVIREFEMMQAIKASKGNEDDDDFSIRVREVIPGKRLPDGSIQSPSIRERLILPGYEYRVGD